MRYFIAALIGIGLIILVIALIFHGGGSKSPLKVIKLTDYATAYSGVRLTIDGPVSASATHYDARITVSQDQATLDIVRGYENDVINSKSYPMNAASYAVFLRALDKVGFTKGTSDKALSDERGYCATGNRYIYELRDGEHEVERFWSTSCGAGTYKGIPGTTRALFEAQVPDYNKLAGPIGL